MGRILSLLRSKASAYAAYRRIRARLFSGTPILVHVYARSESGEEAWSLLYKNGLMLTLGEAGILDYQDARFAHFTGARGGEVGMPGRPALVQLHRIVLKSLLKYLVHPRLEESQREAAAEAAATLWMAWESQTDGPPVAAARRRARHGA